MSNYLMIKKKNQNHCKFRIDPQIAKKHELLVKYQKIG